MRHNIFRIVTTTIFHLIVFIQLNLTRRNIWQIRALKMLSRPKSPSAIIWIALMTQFVLEFQLLFLQVVFLRLLVVGVLLF